jgi:hypothetical protein
MELDEDEDERLEEEEEEEDEEGDVGAGVAYTEPTWGGSGSGKIARSSLHSTRRGWATASSSSTPTPTPTPTHASSSTMAFDSYYAGPPSPSPSPVRASTTTTFVSRRGAADASRPPAPAPSPSSLQPVRCAYSYATDDDSPVPQEKGADDEGDVWVVGDVRDAYYGTPYGSTSSPAAQIAVVMTTTATSAGGGNGNDDGGGDEGMEWRRDPYAYCLDGDEPGRQLGYTGGRGGRAAAPAPYPAPSSPVHSRKGRSAPGLASSTIAYGHQHAEAGGTAKKPERRKLSLSATLNQKTSYDGECERDWNALLQSILEMHEDTLERRAKKVKGMNLHTRTGNLREELFIDTMTVFVRHTELQRLCLDFSEVVCRFGELIIREIVLDDDAKTLKPVRPTDGTFGVAGGDKYIVVRAVQLYWCADKRDGGC